MSDDLVKWAKDAARQQATTQELAEQSGLWIMAARIEALTAKLGEVEAERSTDDTLLDECEAVITDLLARERDAYQRGFKAALGKALGKAQDEETTAQGHIDGLQENPYGYTARNAEKVWTGRRIAARVISEAISAIPLPDTKGDDT